MVKIKTELFVSVLDSQSLGIRCRFIQTRGKSGYAICITRPVKSNAVRLNAYDTQTHTENYNEIQEYLRVQLTFCLQSNQGRTEGKVGIHQ